MRAKIIIKDIEVKCIIGVRDYERIRKQKLFIDIELYFNITKAVKCDNLKYSVDYYSVYKDVKSFIEKSNYFLIETLAEKIGERILKRFNLARVMVGVKKPSALKGAKYAGVEVIINR